MLRSGVYRGDGGAVVALAPRAPGHDDALQQLGDGFAAALAQDLEGASELTLAYVRCESASSAATATLSTISRRSLGYERRCRSSLCRWT